MAPSRRSMWSGHVTFGLTSIPVKLYTTLNGDRDEFHHYHRECGTRVTQPRFCSRCNAFVETDDVGKGIDGPHGQTVLFTTAELDSVKPAALHTMPISSFVWADDLDTRFISTPYYLMPEQGSRHQFGALHMAMQELNRVALGRVVLRTAQNPVVLRAVEGGMICHLLHWPELVREPDWVDLPTTQPLLLKEAHDIVEQMTGRFVPSDWINTTRQAMTQLIDKKLSELGA